ncbi:helix-turn-helix domain-containing protein [Porticoccus sp.]
MAYRIRTTRQQAGLSQAQLATETRLTQQMISKLESGQSRSTSAIFAIARALGVCAEWLWLGGDKTISQPFDHDLAHAWQNLSEEQRAEISDHIMSLSTELPSK